MKEYQVTKARGVSISVAFCVVLLLVICAELFYQAFCEDVVYLRPMRECTACIRESLLDPVSSCPLSGGVVGYEAFSQEGNASESSDALVLAADKSLFHRQSVSLYASPLRFGMVLLSNGEVVRWVGVESMYQEAISRAKKSINERTVERFFSQSTECDKVMMQMSTKKVNKE